MNLPSHYQRDFFTALRKDENVDLVVRYFSVVSALRQKEGWATHYELDSYEQYVSPSNSVEEMLEFIPDWKQRIHISNCHFNAELIELFSAKGVRWCHWSETPGIRLAELLGFRIWLYRLLRPLMLMAKYKEGVLVKNHALLAFGQGVMAEKSFRLMGIPRAMISDLYYTPKPLSQTEPSKKILQFTRGRKVFLSVCALCKRKGIDVLLKSFADLSTNDWCLVVCGFDNSGGEYERLAEKLGIQEQVLFLGAYPVNKIAEVYCAADVFILASRFDGWGAVLNEAASLGLPLIGTDMCGASWHLIRHRENGFRVKADSSRALMQAMQMYVEKPALIELHGKKSKELFYKEFTPDKNSERLVSTVKNFLACK